MAGSEPQGSWTGRGSLVFSNPGRGRCLEEMVRTRCPEGAQCPTDLQAAISSLVSGLYMVLTGPTPGASSAAMSGKLVFMKYLYFYTELHCSFRNKIVHVMFHLKSPHVLPMVAASL